MEISKNKNSEYPNELNEFINRKFGDLQKIDFNSD